MSRTEKASSETCCLATTMRRGTPMTIHFSDLSSGDMGTESEKENFPSTERTISLISTTARIICMEEKRAFTENSGRQQSMKIPPLHQSPCAILVRTESKATPGM